MTNKKYVIYKHTSPSGKSYIGQTSNYESRCRQHKSKSHCFAFLNAIKKYGWNSFTHEILEENLTLEEANEKEVFYIEIHNTFSPNGYNLVAGGDNYKRSDETKLRISASQKGKIMPKHTEEHKAKISSALIGRKHTEESRLKMSISARGQIAPNKGVPMSEEQKEKLRKPRTEQQKLNMKKAAQNRPPVSEETKQKLREANIGKKHTEETRKKMRMSAKNVIHYAVSDTTKAKISKTKTGKTWSEARRLAYILKYGDK